VAKPQQRTSTTGGSGLSETATIGDVKRYLCRLIQRVDRGRVSVPIGNCLGQLCNVLINSILDHELEERMTQLEAEHANGWQPSPYREMTIRGGSHGTEKKSVGTA